jgi:hypothetical protein
MLCCVCALLDAMDANPLVLLSNQAALILELTGLIHCAEHVSWPMDQIGRAGGRTLAHRRHRCPRPPPSALKPQTLSPADRLTGTATLPGITSLRGTRTGTGTGTTCIVQRSCYQHGYIKASIALRAQEGRRRGWIDRVRMAAARPLSQTTSYGAGACGTRTRRRPRPRRRRPRREKRPSRRGLRLGGTVLERKRKRERRCGFRPGFGISREPRVVRVVRRVLCQYLWWRCSPRRRPFRTSGTRSRARPRGRRGCRDVRARSRSVATTAADDRGANTVRALATGGIRDVDDLRGLDVARPRDLGVAGSCGGGRVVFVVVTREKGEGVVDTNCLGGISVASHKEGNAACGHLESRDGTERAPLTSATTWPSAWQLPAVLLLMDAERMLHTDASPCRASPHCW